MDGMKSLGFQRVVLYDSSQDGDVMIDFPTGQQWKMVINHLRFFSKDGESWTDPVAFLKIYSSASQFVGTTIVNGGTRIVGAALPITFADQIAPSTVIGTFRGFANQGAVDFSFSMLDGSKTKVDVKRIIVIFTIMAEDGK
jgi:hypothetical protein